MFGHNCDRDLIFPKVGSGAELRKHVAGFIERYHPDLDPAQGAMNY